MGSNGKIVHNGLARALRWRQNMLHARIVVTALIMFLVGCEAGDVYSTKYADMDKALGTRSIAEHVSQALGAAPEDLVITAKRDGTTLLHNADGVEFEIADFTLKENQRITKVIQIFQISGSRTCNYYWDSNGNKKWYPKPDCPH